MSSTAAAEGDGVSLLQKYVLMVTVVVLASGTALAIRLTKDPETGTHPFSTPVVVLLAELFKLVLSLWWAMVRGLYTIPSWICRDLNRPACVPDSVWATRRVAVGAPNLCGRANRCLWVGAVRPMFIWRARRASPRSPCTIPLRQR